MKKAKKVKKQRRYKIEVSEDQARLISRACELYGRLKMSQLEEINNLFMFNGRKYDGQVARCYLRGLKQVIFPELNTNAYYGIGMKQIGDGTQALELYQTIRYKLSWDDIGKDPKKDRRDWKTMMTVDYNEPTQYGKESLAKIEEVK